MELIELTYKKPQCSESTHFRMPLFRRAYPPLIANKIVSVQPLLGPTGLMHYLKFRYSSKISQESKVPGPDSTNEVKDLL